MTDPQPTAAGRERGISEDWDVLERYEPEASGAIATECPGCGGVIVVFQDGTVAQPRTTTSPSRRISTSLLDSAFEKHFCPARPGLYACIHCGERSDDEAEADQCCSGPYERHGFVKVQGAERLTDSHQSAATGQTGDRDD